MYSEAEGDGVGGGLWGRERESEKVLTVLRLRSESEHTLIKHTKNPMHMQM